MAAFLYYGLALFVLLLIWQLFLLTWWNPRKIEKKLNAQGIRGPPYKFLFGNLKELAKIYRDPTSFSPPSTFRSTHPILQQTLPHYHNWKKEYGRTYMYWYGPRQRIVINEPELVKQIMSNPRLFPKSVPHPSIYQMVGHSLVVSDGERWSGRRKFLNPLFNIESLKVCSSLKNIFFNLNIYLMKNVSQELAPIAVRSTKELIDRWSNLIGASTEQEIEAYTQFKTLTKDVIGRALCGEDYEQAQTVFDYQAQQILLVSQGLISFYMPGMRFLPTPYNIKCWWLTRKIDQMFANLVEKRCKKRGQDDLLEAMMSQNDKHKALTKQDIIEECKTMFVAGFETTSLLLAWASVLLGIHTEWQEKARKEVEEVLDGKPPTADSLSRLKIITMIINETLRLFTPAPIIARKVDEPMKLGNFDIPAGTQLDMPLLAIQHDTEQWGEDADEFNPSRFANGVSKASKHPMAHMPFAIGPRICIGLNLSMIEARIALAMVLQSFSLTISPSYKHAPTRGITLTPKHGAHIIIKKI